VLAWPTARAARRAPPRDVVEHEFFEEFFEEFVTITRARP
jgi:hypothetical protein